ncbi:hypothetical protein LTR56_005391 [Elasticomyces elasticus]|nr:hypothetical protein LTR22_020623 [Elasticomyces elasticus]KAK3651883.1 hypothetical protein LTR56_005391 [Elasticomyces elasticus]KAK4927778.1 hypothetical protein LTR49_005403 [Elasticomyces elasticus]KAK5761449.1 hypothetical protein LTS12_008411 [Elasticomyces elasticus]
MVSWDARIKQLADEVFTNPLGSIEAERHSSPDDSLAMGVQSMSAKLSTAAKTNYLKPYLPDLPDRKLSLLVDLDSADEGGKPKKSGKEKKHRIVIKQTNTVGIQVLAFLPQGQVRLR